MSMNINICAEGMVTFPSGITKYSETSFDCLQTPTPVTEHIIASPDPIQAYKEWVLSIWDKDEPEETFDINTWDDSTGYYKSTGFIPYNRGKEHIEKLDNFITDAKLKGLTIETYSM